MLEVYREFVAQTEGGSQEGAGAPYGGKVDDQPRGPVLYAVEGSGYVSFYNIAGQ